MDTLSLLQESAKYWQEVRHLVKQMEEKCQSRYLHPINPGQSKDAAKHRWLLWCEEVEDEADFHVSRAMSAGTFEGVPAEIRFLFAMKCRAADFFLALLSYDLVEGVSVSPALAPPDRQPEDTLMVLLTEWWDSPGRDLAFDFVWQRHKDTQEPDLS